GADRGQFGREIDLCMRDIGFAGNFTFVVSLGTGNVLSASHVVLCNEERFLGAVLGHGLAHCLAGGVVLPGVNEDIGVALFASQLGGARNRTQHDDVSVGS